MRYLALFLVFFLPMLLSGQSDSVRLGPRFRFAAGVFRTWEAIRQNRPELTWKELDSVMAVNPQSMIARVQYIRRKADKKALDSLAAFSQGGLLYLPLLQLPRENGAQLYAGLWELGRICLYTYAQEVTRMVEITAYVPETKQPFRRGKVPRTESIPVTVMFDFLRGKRAELNRDNLLEWIREDDTLYGRVSQLKPEALDLLRVVQTFNDRNPVFIPKPQRE